MSSKIEIYTQHTVPDYTELGVVAMAAAMEASRGGKYGLMYRQAGTHIHIGFHGPADELKGSVSFSIAEIEDKREFYDKVMRDSWAELVAITEREGRISGRESQLFRKPPARKHVKKC